MYYYPRSNDILVMQLAEKGWGYKSERYKTSFDYVKFQNIVQNPHVSIILGGWKYDHLVFNNIKKMKEQIKDDAEIIFVNNGSDDDVFKNIIPLVDTYVRLKNNTGAYIFRNIGSLFAKAPILFFLEDDCVPNEHLLKSHLAIHQEFSVHAVRGRVLVLTPDSEQPKHYDLGSELYPTFNNFEGNVTYQAEAFFQVGGWDDDIIMGHGGYELSIKLFKLSQSYNKQVYTPDALIYHDFAKEPERAERKKQLQGESLTRLKAKYPFWKGFFKSWIVHQHDQIERIQSSLKESYQNNQDTWSGYKIKNDKENEQKSIVPLARTIENHHLNLPKITIGIPTYNRSTMLIEALESCFIQEYPHLEILVADDGSTDNTEEILNSVYGFQKDGSHTIHHHKKIRYLKKENEGLNRTRNFIIKHAEGEYILWLNDDDLIAPDMLQKYAYALLMINPDVIYCNQEYYSSKDQIITKVFTPTDFSHLEKYLLGHLVLNRRLPITGSLMSKKLLQEIGMFDVDFSRSQEIEIWSRLAKKAKFHKVEEILYRLRIHDHNTCMTLPVFIDHSFASKIIKRIIKKNPVQELFPPFDESIDNEKIKETCLDWESKTQKIDLANNIAFGFYKCRDYYSCITVLETVDYLSSINTIHLFVTANFALSNFSEARKCAEYVRDKFGYEEMEPYINVMKYFEIILYNFSLDYALPEEEVEYIESYHRSVGIYPSFYYYYLAKQQTDQELKFKYFLKFALTEPENKLIRDTKHLFISNQEQEIELETSRQRILERPIWNNYNVGEKASLSELPSLINPVPIHEESVYAENMCSLSLAQGADFYSAPANILTSSTYPSYNSSPADPEQTPLETKSQILLTKPNPLISICIPTYNRVEMLKEALKSALNQSFSNYEIVVLDDGSTDGTAEMMKHEFESRETTQSAENTFLNIPKIRYYSKANEGRPKTRNQLIKLAQGEFILWLDDDDLLVKDILVVYAEYIEKYPNVSMFYGNKMLMGNYFLYAKDEGIFEDNYQKNKDLLARSVSKSRLPNPGACIKKSVYEQWGFYDESFLKAQDTEFWSRIMDKILFKNINTFSVFYRWHENNVSTDHINPDYSYESRILSGYLDRFTLQELFPYYDWNDQHNSLLLAYFELGKHYANFFDELLAIEYYSKAFSMLGVQENLTIPQIISNVRKFFVSEAMLIEHIKALAKLLPFNEHAQPIEVYHPYIHYTKLLQHEKAKITQKKKILYVLHDFPPQRIAGIQVYAINIAHELMNQYSDLQIDFFHPVFREEKSDYTIEKTHYHHSPSTNYDSEQNTSPSISRDFTVYKLYKPQDGDTSLDRIKNYLVGIAFMNFLKENKYDLIHFQSFGQLSVIVAEVAQELGIPTFFTIHDSWFLCYLWQRYSYPEGACTGPEHQIMYEDTENWQLRHDKCCKCLLTKVDYTPEDYKHLRTVLDLRQTTFQHIFQRFDQVFCVSKYIKNVYQEYFNREITVNYIGFNEIVASPADKQGRENILTFGYMGQIEPRKGLDILVNAFQWIKNPDVRLVVYGYSKHIKYYNQLMEVAEKDPRIIFYGEYAPQEQGKLIQSIDVMVVPSQFETFGLVTVEAFQYQIPVIGSNSGGIPEVLLDGYNGLLFENNNDYDLYLKMQYLIDNPQKIAELSSNCRIPRHISEEAAFLHNEYLHTVSRDYKAVEPDSGKNELATNETGVTLPIASPHNEKDKVIPRGNKTDSNAQHTIHKRVLVYYFKNVHIPVLNPITEALLQRKDIDLAIGYMQYAPDIRAGFLPYELKSLKGYNLPMYSTPQDFYPDYTIIADSVYPWVENCGKLIHIGHGVLSKGQYYTDTKIAKREEQADFICVPGNYHKQIMEKIVNKPIIATGMAKLDGIFNGSMNREREMAKRKFPPYYYYVLYAPTFNDELSSLPEIQEKIIEVLPSPDSILLVKLHGSTAQKYKDLFSQLHLKDDRVLYISELDITPYLCIADVLISDVSSVMMEFAALDKPIVLYNNPRRKKYKNYNPKDLEYSHRDIGYQVNNLEEMKIAILKIHRGQDLYQERRKEISDMLFANKYDGKAVERILECINL